MANPAVPLLNTQEPVILTPYSVTSTPQQVDPWAIDVLVIVPSGTVATIQTADGVTFTSDTTIGLNSNGRPLANTFIISRASGSGTITVLVSRVAGKESTNA